MRFAQDYSKYGVTSVEDKQRLFRLIKSINRSGEYAGAGPAEAALSHLEVTEQCCACESARVRGEE